MFLQLRVVLSLDFRKPPIISLGSPQHFVFESSINIGCFREPPPFLQVHKSQMICLQGAPDNCWKREPPSILQGTPNVFVFYSSVIIGFLAPTISLGSLVKRVVYREHPTIVRIVSMQDPQEAPNLVLAVVDLLGACLLYTSPSPRDRTRSRMPSSA